MIRAVACRSCSVSVAGGLPSPSIHPLSIAMTRAALAETVRQARARHAAALILVPVFTPEQPGERMIRQRVLDDAGLPYVQVSLDPRWRLAGDGHPDARANRAMAAAVLAGLRRQRPDLFDPSSAPR